MQWVRIHHISKSRLDVTNVSLNQIWCSQKLWTANRLRKAGSQSFEKDQISWSGNLWYYPVLSAVKNHILLFYGVPFLSYGVHNESNA